MRYVGISNFLIFGVDRVVELVIFVFKVVFLGNFKFFMNMIFSLGYYDVKLWSKIY